MFETPILLIIFNRPDTTKRVFEAIRQQKPKFLFVAADGPRSDREDDIEKCKAAREIIKVDWECEFHTLYREENFGCGRGPAEAITWFFTQVSEGIILEDDCLPSAAFFGFCKKMLETYRTEERIFVISGTNPLIKLRFNFNGYFIAKFGGTWGWATWKRAWKYFDHDMAAWNSNYGRMEVNIYLNSKSYFKVFEDAFNIYSIPNRKNDVWDYQWLFARFIHKSYSIIPSTNLISNLGFGTDSHHTPDPTSILSNMKITDIGKGIIVRKFKISQLYDYILFEKFYNPSGKSIMKKIFIKLLCLAIRIKN